MRALPGHRICACPDFFICLPASPAASDGRARSPLERQDGHQPARTIPELREVFQSLAMVLMGTTHASNHVRDGRAASEKVPILQARIHHAVQADHLIRMPLIRVRKLVRA